MRGNYCSLLNLDNIISIVVCSKIHNGIGIGIGIFFHSFFIVVDRVKHQRCRRRSCRGEECGWKKEGWGRGRRLYVFSVNKLYGGLYGGGGRFVWGRV